ncbi:MAG TPA: COX15/CtaA family protein [Gemmatimonadaceae bacterium]|nr:COX15/CtaA family protein [Gemmatimonadaceae bacterium]
MKALRRLAYSTLALAYALIVFGAIVRISGSGMGCGDHWPRCFGRWFPPMDQPTLVIEWTHRLLAAITVAMVALLVLVAFRKRSEPRVSGRGGVLRASVLAALLIVVQALLGMVTVRLGNTAWATVAHLLNGALLLAALATTVLRAGGLGGGISVGAVAARTRAARGSAAAAAIALCTVLFGGLTAKIPGANSACEGFPLCRGSLFPALPAQHVQFTHRILAFLLFFHVLGLVIGFARRREAAAVNRLVRVAFALICLQLVIAAGMVEMHLPPVMRSLHEADGIAIWLTLFALAWLARFSSASAAHEVGRVADGAGSRSVAARAAREAAT